MNQRTRIYFIIEAFRDGAWFMPTAHEHDTVPEAVTQAQIYYEDHNETEPTRIIEVTETVTEARTVVGEISRVGI
jgi:hypothetical protein